MKLKKENNIPGAKSEVEIFNPRFVLSKTVKFKTGFFSSLEFCLLKAEKNKLNFLKKLYRLYLTYIIYSNRSAFVIACFPIYICLNIYFQLLKVKCFVADSFLV